MSNLHRKPFETAHAEFKAAEKELIRLNEQKATATTNLAEAHVRAANAKQQSETLVASGDVTNLDKLTNASQQQVQTEHVARLLETGLTHVDTQIVDATAKLLAIEGKCRDLQAAFFNAEFNELASDFLRAHRTELERLVNVMAFDSLHGAVRSQGPITARMVAVSGYGALFDQALPVIAQQVFGDAGWQGLVAQPIKGAIVCDPIISPAVADADRAAPYQLRDAVAIRRVLEQNARMRAEQDAAVARLIEANPKAA